MDLKEFNKRTHDKGTKFKVRIKPVIHCKDGYRFSCQASIHHFCNPQENVEEYTTMELGGWDLEDIDAFDGEGVALRVPVELIQKMIDNHGGIDEAKTFKTVLK